MALEVAARFRSGTLFERSKTWEGFWVSYGDVTIFVLILLVSAIAGCLWSWLARRRENRILSKEYEKRRGAA